MNATKSRIIKIFYLFAVSKLTSLDLHESCKLEKLKLVCNYSFWNSISRVFRKYLVDKIIWITATVSLNKIWKRKVCTDDYIVDWHDQLKKNNFYSTPARRIRICLSSFLQGVVGWYLFRKALKILLYHFVFLINLYNNYFEFHLSKKNLIWEG